MKYDTMPLLPNYAKCHVEPVHLTIEQETLINAFTTLQGEIMSVDILSEQYAIAFAVKNEQNKKRCKNLLVEHAKLLLDAAEKL